MEIFLAEGSWIKVKRKHGYQQLWFMWAGAQAVTWKLSLKTGKQAAEHKEQSVYKTVRTQIDMEQQNKV